MVYAVNDKVGTFKVIQATTTGDADNDLDNLVAQRKESLLAVFWDLDASIAPIIAELPKYTQTALDKTGKCIWLSWDLFYIKGKVFSVCYNSGKNWMFYSLKQFFPSDDLSKDEYEQSIIAYPELTQRLADELEHALHIMGIWTNKLSSPAAIFQDYYGKHLDLPTYKDFMPKYSGLLEYAAMCAGNEWTEVMKVGHFAECYSYDRKSAYGNQMMGLLNNSPRCMGIVQSDKYIPEAEYAYCRCDIEIKSNVTLHPIFHIGENGALSSRTGEWRGVITKKQMDFIKRWQIGDYEIINGWWMTPKSRVMPLGQIIPRILAFKEHPNKLVQFLAKNMVNGFAGKFNEEYKERVGDLYNPMWSAEIITGNALALCETIYKNKCHNDVIQIKVDEFKTTRKLAAIPEGYKESSGECIALDNQNVFYKNQHPDNINLVQALEMINEHPNLSYYKRGNAVIDFWKRDLTRTFKELPTSGAELMNNVYESKLLTIGEEL